MTNSKNANLSNVGALYRQAVDRFQQGDLHAAGQMVHRILVVDSAHADANHLAGIIAIHSGQYESAVSAIDRAIQSNPLDAGYYYNYGIALSAAGHTSEALAAYENALQLKPEFLEVYINRGIILTSIGRLEEALTCYAGAIRIKPDHAVAYFNRGNTLAAMQRIEAAQIDYERAIQLHPDFVDAHFNLANTFKKTQRWEQARKTFEKVTQLNPGHAGAHHAQGELLVLRSNPEAALAAFDHAIVSMPEFAQAHFNRGQCLKLLGQLPEAADAYRTALQHDPEHVDAAYFLAVVDADKPPVRSPQNYIVKEFDGFADTFDKHLVGALGYQIPWQLFEAVCGLHGDTLKKHDILDLGCGTGLVGAAFSTIARRLDGVDLSPQMLVRARARGIYTDLIEMDVCQALKQASHCYDLILAADVFIYIGDLAELFSLAALRLHGGGLLAFSIEVIEDGQEYRLAHTGRYGQSCDYIRCLAASNGLVEVKSVPTVVRTEDNKPVDGYIMVLRRLPPDPA